MKLSNLSKLVGASVIATTLAVASLNVPVHAQDTAPRTYVEPDGEVESVETENDFDWGWLGLLGLTGLAGLAGRKRHETVHTHYSNDDPNVRVGSTSNYR